MLRNMCALVFVLSLAAGAEAQSVSSSALACESLSIEPLVTVDVTGGGWLFVHATVVVYSNGMASVANLHGDVRALFVDPSIAHGLRRNLVTAGVLTLCDQDEVLDAPLTAVTVLDPDGHADTLNYWVAEGAYGRIQAVIDEFLGAQFPGFTIY